MEILTNFSIPASHLNKNLVSEVYWKVNEGFFPEKGWTDFTVIILGWWTQELLAQLDGKEVGQYDFMDGPFYVEARITVEDKILLHFKERRRSGINVLFTADVEIKDFFSSLKSISNLVLRQCYHNSYKNEDVSKLELNYQKLSSIKRPLS